MRIRVRWNAPRTSTMVVAGCARRASPWTRQLTGNPAAIESQNGEHSDVVRTGLCFWRIKAACEGTCAARDHRRQDMLCVPRAAVARSSPWRAREQPESRDRRKILSFEKELDFFEPHMHSIHKCLQIFSSQAQGERGRAQAWRRARHRCARYAQHVVPSARARLARCIHSLDPPEG